MGFPLSVPTFHLDQKLVFSYFHILLAAESIGIWSEFIICLDAANFLLILVTIKFALCVTFGVSGLPQSNRSHAWT